MNPFLEVANKITIDDDRLAAVEAADRQRAAEERRKAQTELRIHLVECGCPAKDLRRVLDEPEKMISTKSLWHARQSHSRGESMLVLSGPRGIGKTTAAAWWLVQEREPVEYVRTTFPLFVEAGLLARYDRYNKPEMRTLTRARALVIDDLGTEYLDGKGAFVSLFGEVMNARYAAELPTLITTNMLAAEFKERYKERIADRIREVGRYIELEGESLRGKR